MSTEGRWAGLRVLLTGATSGIGRDTAARLASEGAIVLVHGRARDRVDALVAEIQGAGGRAEGLVADLVSLKDTARIAHATLAAGPLDVLINNAGVGFGSDRAQRETSADGFELRFAVNYLAPFVLTHLLLTGGAPTRAVINVASAGQAPVEMDDLQSTRSYDGVEAYRRSKLALVMFTLDLAEAFPSVASNALHPGTFLDTSMVRDAGIRPLGPAARGTEVIEHVLAASLFDKISGRYFDEQRITRAEAQAYDVASRRELRRRTLELVRPIVPELATI